MAEHDPWKSLNIQDKLRIFVSSRINECADERRFVRAAIDSINHEAILFEHLGARAVSPRILYLSRLVQSQIMVAIYRDGYGYIDSVGGMEISGLEDELRKAQEYKIPILFYVHAEDKNREKRLAELIDEVSPNATISFYNEANELQLRVRDDVTAEISRKYLNPELRENVLLDTAADTLSRLTLRQGAPIVRSELLRQIDDLSKEGGTLCIFGESGIGKTTLAAQFAEETSALFINSSGVSPLDLFSVLTTLLAGQSVAVDQHSTLLGARLAFSSYWANAAEVCLVLDECEFIDSVIDAALSGGGTSSRKRIIYTSRSFSGSGPSIEIPKLESNELKKIAKQVDPKLLFESTNGSPSDITSELVDISEKLRTYSPISIEILSYLALSPEPISAKNMLILLGNEKLSIEGLYNIIGEVSKLIDDSSRGLRLINSDISQTLSDIISATPQRLRFYSIRLVDMFNTMDNPGAAYKVAAAIGDDTELEYAIPAIIQSAQNGDFQLGIKIAEKQLSRALDREQRTEALSLMLGLVYPLQIVGEAVKASEILSNAKIIAEDIGGEASKRYELALLEDSARRTLSVEDVNGLQKIFDKYEEFDQDWDRARIGLELSVLYMGAKDYDRAVVVLRTTLDIFESCSDLYGVDLAERNLASSLSAIAGNDEEVERLIKQVDQRAAKTGDGRRQRAWTCNLLNRRYRESGKLDKAQAAASEALKIATELGDESLRAITFINLGNVYADQERVADALDAYASGGIAAQKVGRRDIEADSSRFQAKILNDFAESASFYPDRVQQAKTFAQHAIGLVEGSIYGEARARSYIELGKAEEELGNPVAATKAYFKAAREYRALNDTEPFERALLWGAELSLEADSRLYLAEMFDLFSVGVDHEYFQADLFLNLIPVLIANLPKEIFIRLLGRHLREIEKNLPTLLKRSLLEGAIEAIDITEVRNVVAKEPWRILYTSIVLSFLFRGVSPTYLKSRLAESITRSVDGLDVRELGHGDSIWTTSLDFGEPTTITIECIDQSHASSVAAQTLAAFLKAFEDDIVRLVGKPEIAELVIQVINYAEMPDDLKMIFDSMDGRGLLTDQSVAVTRPVGFGDLAPTFVVIEEDFIGKVKIGEGEVGSLQSLLLFTLIEIVHQLLRGEVDYDSLTPKVTALVRKTMS